MLEVIEKLLLLQDCDRKLGRVQGELSHIHPERLGFQTRTKGAEAALEAARNKARHLETTRKSLELEVEGKKQLINKYLNQQLQTRKNEEYRALTHEIEMCKEDIRKIEDQEIELMEQSEAAQKEIVRATAGLASDRGVMEDQITKLASREESLKKELADLLGRRQELAGRVEESARARYERLIRHKGENVVVGVQHGVCGGCHMRLPAQIMVQCQGQQELVACTNCGRILYYTADMDLAVAD